MADIDLATVEIGTKVWRIKVHGTGKYSDSVESFFIAAPNSGKIICHRGKNQFLQREN